MCASRKVGNLVLPTGPLICSNNILRVGEAELPTAGSMAEKKAGLPNHNPQLSVAPHTDLFKDGGPVITPSAIELTNHGPHEWRGGGGWWESDGASSLPGIIPGSQPH